MVITSMPKLATTRGYSAGAGTRSSTYSRGNGSEAERQGARDGADVEASVLFVPSDRSRAVTNAVGHRGAQYMLIVRSPLGSFATDTLRTAHQRLVEALAPWTTGQYPNCMCGEEGHHL